MTDTTAASSGSHGVVVFDSNVLIPLIIPASRSTRLFLRLDAAGWKLTVTPQILHEVEDKLRNKARLRKWLGVADEDITAFMSRLAAQCRQLPGNEPATGAVPADPTDDKIIGAAIEANADYIVSEDRHLLDLGSHKGTPILTRDDLDAELDRLGVPRLSGT